MDYNIDFINDQVKFDGFFSEYLPPAFSIRHPKVDIFNVLPPKNFDLIEPAIYTMSRFNENNEQRNIYIPEICSYVALMNFVVKNNILEDIINFSIQSPYSFSPIIGDDGTLLRHEQCYDNLGVLDEISSNFISNTIIKLNRSRGAKGILYLDCVIRSIPTSESGHIRSANPV